MIGRSWLRRILRFTISQQGIKKMGRFPESGMDRSYLWSAFGSASSTNLTIRDRNPAGVGLWFPGVSRWPDSDIRLEKTGISSAGGEGQVYEDFSLPVKWTVFIGLLYRSMTVPQVMLVVVVLEH